LFYNIVHQIAELYDQIETYQDDVIFLKTLIRGLEIRNILEPFCGTGRVLLPLAESGYPCVGMDNADGMLSLARLKTNVLPADIQKNVSLVEKDVLLGDWPSGFDLVILGSNCFYELGTFEEQERIIKFADTSLNPGGYLFIDNNHMEGDLDLAWQMPGLTPAFPTGICKDGTKIDSFKETIWFDIKKRLVRIKRITKIETLDGQITEKEIIQQKHPVSTCEVKGWLDQYGFSVLGLFGDRQGNPYNEKSTRAIFWARKD
jgi:SAM-dependent methyltransferase